MFRHHVLIALRNVIRHKGSFFINLVGLSSGLACAILIFLWVHDELSKDKFHVNEPQLYQVMEKSNENGKVIVKPNTQGLLAESMEKEYPEIESAICYLNIGDYGQKFSLKTSKNTFVKSRGVFASSDFFNTFSYKLISGNKNEVLKEKGSLIISKSLAQALFGKDENPIGKQVEWEVIGKKNTCTVSGIMSDVTAQSTQQFDFVLTKDLMFEMFPNFKEWYNEGTNTFLQLKKGTEIAQFNAKIKDYLQSKQKGGSIFSLFVRPYSNAYLYGHYENGKQMGGRIGYVKIFSLIAFFILFIACINFMNLSTAKASLREKEVGIKKAIGSTRKGLVNQFLTEAVVISLFSLLVAIGIVYFFLPKFNLVTDKTLTLQLSPSTIFLILGATVLTGLVSGSYPAIYLSGFNVISILKGKLKASFGEIMARQGLVVFQFVISLLLIIAVIVIYQQMKLIQTMNLGYDRDHVVQFENEGGLKQSKNLFLTQLRNIPGVAKASLLSEGIAQTINISTTYGIQWPGKSKDDLTNFSVKSVDYDLIETLNMKILEGRSFSPAFGNEKRGLIFNETAIRTMGLKDPIGTRISMWGDDSMSIIGVVKDFHLTSIHEAILPLVMRYEPDDCNMVMVKILAGREQSTLAQIETLYKQTNPGFAFNYDFVDQQYQLVYAAEQRVAALTKYFAFLAILISCLGLFGLASFNAEVRAREIGIRKVLGAGISSVVLLLSRDFIKLALIAVLIGFPLSWWAMNKWLSSFAYKVDIGPWIFFTAFGLILGITLLTVGYQAVKAAIANPVKSLRTE